MRYPKLLVAAVLVIAAALMIFSTSCFANTGLTGSAATTTPTVVTPNPRIEQVIATTSGTKSAYYATLDIKAKNEGAEGTILVIASVVQNGKTTTNEMEVFLKQGETHELKMTFPLVWQGGEFTSKVEAIVP
jgi:hypothetical protein